MIQGMEKVFTYSKFALFFSLGLGGSAWGIGSASVESTGFLRNSSNRASSATTLFVGPEWQGEGRYLGGKVSVQAVALVENKSAVTFYGKDFALQSSSKVSENNRVSLGRRHLDWSMSDGAWRSGIWNPRFLHDALAPRTAGLDGLFAEVQPLEWLKIQAMGSYLSLPEMGYPTETKNGKLVTANPWNVPPPESLVIQGKEVSIRYLVEYPSTASMILKPSAALAVRAGKKTGLWGSATYGFLPIHQPDLTVEASLRPRETALDAVIRPRILSHHLAQLEAGWVDEDWVGWSSVTREMPIGFPSVKGRFDRPVGPSWIFGFGNELKLTPKIAINQAFIYVRESLPTQSTTNPLANVSLPLPSRFPLERAIRAGMSWSNLERWAGDAALAHDLLYSSTHISTGVAFKSGWLKNELAEGGITFTAGVDGIFSQSAKGWIGNQKGNDRMRGGVSYAF